MRPITRPDPSRPSLAAASWIVAASILVASGCASDVEPPCEGYPQQADSPYVLPWTPGLAFEVLTGNCRDDIPTHSGERRYAYDFRMPVGTLVRAARGGEVVVAVDEYSDEDHTFGHENHVFVIHGDGTFGLYFHFARGGLHVAVGTPVERGDPLGVVGTSGAIGPDLIPHLHFEVAARLDPIRSAPVVFSNTRAHTEGLVEGEVYRAEPY